MTIFLLLLNYRHVLLTGRRNQHTWKIFLPHNALRLDKPPSGNVKIANIPDSMPDVNVTVTSEVVIGTQATDGTLQETNILSFKIVKSSLTLFKLTALYGKLIIFKQFRPTGIRPIWICICILYIQGIRLSRLQVYTDLLLTRIYKSNNYTHFDQVFGYYTSKNIYLTEYQNISTVKWGSDSTQPANADKMT